MNEITRVVIQDRVMWGTSIVGVLEVKGHQFDEICDTFDELKNSIDCWTFNDLLEGLEKLGWNITFQENVCSYSI